MKIKMELISDVIFGNGMSVPGAEDLSVLHDEYGFPYYKGSTFKGVIREEYERYLFWLGKNEKEIAGQIARLFGENGDDVSEDKITFSDFEISGYVKKAVLDEVCKENSNTSMDDIRNIFSDQILDLFTNVRTFTKVNENGVAQTGSLRMARCVDKGLCLYSEVLCDPDDEAELKEVLYSVKGIGSMRNRGFGKIKLSVEEDA